MEQQPPKRRSPWPALVAAAVVLVVVAGGVVALLATNGEDSGDPGAEETGQAAGELDFEAIDERYRSLGQVVTTDASECVEGQPGPGETETITCTTPDGTLDLTTYASQTDVQALRDETLDHAAGTIVSAVESGAFYAYEPTVADRNSREPAVVYWDSLPGLQSAVYTGAEGVTAETLRRAFDATAPMVTAPTGPADPEVEDLVGRFDVQRCRRVPTRMAGETEESKCVRSGRRTWVAQFETLGDFRKHRAAIFGQAREDRFPVQDFWYVDQNGNQRPDEPEQGKAYGFVEERDDDLAVLYLDDVECRCYLWMHGRPTDNPKILYELLFPSDQSSG